MSVKKAKPSVTKKPTEKKWNAEPVEEGIAIANNDAGFQSPRLDNIVIIGNNQIELKPIGKLISLLSFTDAQRHLLCENDLAEKDDKIEKAEYVIINNVIWVLTAGSKLNFNAQDMQTSYAEEGDVSVGDLSIVYLHASHVNIYAFETSRIKVVNLLFNTQVTTNRLSLGSCALYSSLLKSAEVLVKNSVLKDIAFTAKKVWVKDSKVQAHHICTNGEVSLEGYRSSLSVSGVRTRTFPSIVRNVVIRPNHRLVKNELAIPHTYSKQTDEQFDINIISRLDYGVLNAVHPVNFVRANRCDILLDGLFVSAANLEVTYDRFKNEINGSPNAYCCQAQSDELYLATIRALREKAIADNQSTRYLPDPSNRLENGLILGFIEQLRSRSNLYKQVDFLMDK